MKIKLFKSKSAKLKTEIKSAKNAKPELTFRKEVFENSVFHKAITESLHKRQAAIAALEEFMIESALTDAGWDVKKLKEPGSIKRLRSIVTMYYELPGAQLKKVECREPRPLERLLWGLQTKQTGVKP